MLLIVSFEMALFERDSASLPTSLTEIFTLKSLL